MNGAAAAAAAAAAVAKAIKASGAIVRVEPDEFQKLLVHNAQGLVVHTFGGLFFPGHKYLMGYKGLAFYTSARDPISMPSTCQIVEAKKIWIPGG
jgi:ABC-type branched-subunit amino acid transport system substrate-binding protein